MMSIADKLRRLGEAIAEAERIRGHLDRLRAPERVWCYPWEPAGRCGEWYTTKTRDTAVEYTIAARPTAECAELRAELRERTEAHEEAVRELADAWKRECDLREERDRLRIRLCLIVGRDQP